MLDTKYFLIVDDDSDDRGFFIEAVSRLTSSAQITEAEDGEAALKILCKKNDKLPDYIFLDLNMPGKDGKIVLSELKKDFRLKHIPVFIFSTSSDPRDKEDALLLGANSFITKPYNLKEWPNKIQSALAFNFPMSADSLR